MGLFNGIKRRNKRPSVDPLSSLLAESFGLDPATLKTARPEDALEATAPAWEGMVAILVGSDSPKALLLLGAGLPGDGAEALAARLAAASGSPIAPILRRGRAEAWRLELEHRRMGELRCRMDGGRTIALLVDEGLARLIDARQEPVAAAKAAAAPAVETPSQEGARSFALDHPALLALPALLCPREWQAGGGRAAVSWTGLELDPPETRDRLRWTAAWTVGNGTSKMGFYFELGLPRGAEPASVARAIEPVLAAAWKMAWPGLAAALPGISVPVFGRSAARPARAEVAVAGRLMAGAASLELSLCIPAALLRFLAPQDAPAAASKISKPAATPAATPAAAAASAAAGGPEASIERFLAANDALLETSMSLLAAHGPAPSGGGQPVGALPTLPSFLSLFDERDLARLVQGYFLPEHGALGFQALFFFREGLEATAALEDAAAVAPGPARLVQPFDERRLLAALPAASREEWAEARRASLPLVDRDRAAALEAGAGALSGLWSAFRKGRLELGYDGRRLVIETLGDIIEASDRLRLEELAAQDLPLALLEGLGRDRARRILDRLSARDLAVATWGPARKRPLLEASLSRGKRAELAAEASILGRRLGSGEEAAGAVASAREALAARVRGFLEDFAREEGGPGAGPARTAAASGADRGRPGAASRGADGNRGPGGAADRPRPRG